MTDKGGITIPLFHGIFKGDSITHYDREFDENLYSSLPYLYAICIARKDRGMKKIVAGFFVKTSYSHNDEGFTAAIATAAQSAAELHPFLEGSFSFHPARINSAEGPPLSENEMLDILQKQYVKFSAYGSA